MNTDIAHSLIMVYSSHFLKSEAPNVSSSNELDLTAWPDILQQALVPVIEENECAQIEGYTQKLTANMICAGYQEGRVDSCNV